MDPIHVLIVAGSEIEAELLVHELHRTGRAIDFERVATADGMRGALERTSWDVVVADGATPELGTRVALGILREMRAAPPFIVVASTFEEEAIVDAMRAGARDYVLKDKLWRLAPVVLRELGGGSAVVERSGAEEPAPTSEARLAHLWDSDMIVVAVFDAAGHVRDINQAGLRMLGYSREELLSGMVRWSDISASDWRATDGRGIEQLNLEGVASPRERELIRKDGSRVLVLAATVVLDASARMVIVVDLTEKRRVENDFLERVRLGALSAEVGMALSQGDSLESILQRCADAMVTHLGAALARIWTINPGEKVLELRASAGIYTHVDGPHGRVPVGELKIGLIARDMVAMSTNDILSDSRIHEPEWAMRHGLTSFAGHPLVVADRVIGVVGMFARHPLTDVALKGLGSLADAVAVGVHRKVVEEERHALEAQLRQAQKMEAVGRLAGGIAHDFNNLLSVILSYGEMILSDLRAGDPLRRDVKEIHAAATRAAALTRQLLMFSRQQPIEPEVLDLNDLLSSMDRMLGRLVGEDVQIVSIVEASSSRVLVDPGTMEQVIMNLVLNSRDAMPTGGKLTLEVANVVLDEAHVKDHLGAKPGPYVMLSVTDTGTGMDKATLARVFEPFFTTKEKGKGTGLGLSTVFGIVQESGGYTRASSELGQGTTVTVHLPRILTDIEQLRPRSSPNAPRGSETILLVEDEDPVRDIAHRILRRHGYTVLVARGPGDAVLLCERYPKLIDLLLTDVVMPQMSGPELAERLWTLRPDMKVLCMSGYTSLPTVGDRANRASLAHMQKPITTKSLTTRVREVLDAR